MVKNKAKSIILILACLTYFCSEQIEVDKVRNVDAAYWPVFRGDQNLSGVAEGTIPDNPELLWSFKTGSVIISSPVIGFGNIYIGSTDGKVYTIDLLTGKKVWEFDTEDDIEASPLIIDQTVYIGNLSGDFFALDAVAGKVVWKCKLDDGIMGSANRFAVPGSTEKVVLVGCYDTKMYCFNADSGDLIWTYETDDFINGAPATDGEVIVFGGCDERLHIISGIDGSELGRVWAGSFIAGSAALVDNRAYLGHYDSKLVCIDLTEKKIVWEYQDENTIGEFFSSPAVSKERVVIGSRDYFLHCVDRESGKQVWKYQTRDEIDSSPVIVKDRVVFGSKDGRIYILSLEDGEEIWTYEIGASILGSPAVTGGMIVIGAIDGTVYTFGDNR